MSATEYALWQTFARIEPLGHARGDLQAAIIAQTVANRHRGPREAAYKIADFMPNFRYGRKLRTVDAHKEFFRQLAQASSGRFVEAQKAS